MQGIKWGSLWWLVALVSHDLSSWNCVSPTVLCGNYCSSVCNQTFSSCCLTYTLTYTANILAGSVQGSPAQAVKNLEDVLDRIDVQVTVTNLTIGNSVVLLFKPNGTFDGLQIFASDSQVGLQDVSSSRVLVQLPNGLNLTHNDTLIFATFKLPETNKSDGGAFSEVFDRRLVIMSVQNKTITGLPNPVNITMKFTEEINETQSPSCQFFNTQTNDFSQQGCATHWTPGQDNVTCSCDHFTLFAVLLTSASPRETAKTDLLILSYISVIGCSVSLFALVITVLLFITNRTLREDSSMKIHVNLVAALILLNLHFLPSQAAAAAAAHISPWLCFYLALALHYSLLATFSWMALEGFHLYLLLIKIFNISVSRYLLKLSAVGWGVPAVIVSVVVSIDRGFYGFVSLDSSHDDDTKICYITDDVVKTVTTTGLFTLVFLFNMTMFMVTVKRLLNVGYSKEFGHLHRKGVKQKVCPLLAVSALLGITWGLIFFSFGQASTPVLYLFCVLNSLQGFFIFLWFVISLRKAQSSAPKTSSDALTTNSKTDVK